MSLRSFFSNCRFSKLIYLQNESHYLLSQSNIRAKLVTRYQQNLRCYASSNSITNNVNIANIFDDESLKTRRRQPTSVQQLDSANQQAESTTSNTTRINHIQIVTDELLSSVHDSTYNNEWSKIHERFSEERGLNVYWPFRLMNYFASCDKSESIYMLANDLMNYYKSNYKEKIPMTIAYISVLSSYDHKEFLRHYEHLLSINSIFDSSSCYTLIQALCRTEYYERAIPYLEMVTMTASLSSTHYSAILVASLINRNQTLFQQMIDEMVAANICPNSEVFEKMIALDNEKNQYVAMVIRMLREHAWLPDSHVQQLLSDWFTRGECQCCKKILQPIKTLSEKEFTEIQQDFLSKSLKREDIFLNTNPKELKRFINLIDNNKSFDIVIDALNVAFSTVQKANHSTRARMVEQVVDYFRNSSKNCNILVIGRKHMLKWPRINKLKATCFYAEDISKDDPFMLYAALNSGPRCYVVTRDELRDHRYLLNSESSMNAFKAWQRTHQIYLKSIVNDKPQFIVSCLLSLK